MRCKLIYSLLANVAVLFPLMLTMFSRLIICPDELYQQLFWARDDTQVRNRALERLQVQHTQLKASFEQVLTSSSELLTPHVCLNVYIRERCNYASCPWMDVPRRASSAMFREAMLISALARWSRLGCPQGLHIAMIAEYA
jgi:hypothetical protein